MMYKQEDFYVDSEYGYFIIFGDKVFMAEDVKDIYLYGGAMYLEMADGQREYFNIHVSVVSMPILLDFIKEFKFAKSLDKVNNTNNSSCDKISNYFLGLVLLISIIINVIYLLRG